MEPNKFEQLLLLGEEMQKTLDEVYDEITDDLSDHEADKLANQIKWCTHPKLGQTGHRLNQIAIEIAIIQSRLEIEVDSMPRKTRADKAAVKKLKRQIKNSSHPEMKPFIEEREQLHRSITDQDLIDELDDEFQNAGINGSWE